MKKGSKMTLEQRKKLSDSHKGKPAWWNKGRHRSEESKMKNRLAHLGKPAWNKGKTGIYSEESIMKNRLAHLGKEGFWKGKHHSEEFNIKNREAQKKAWANPELRNRQSEITRRAMSNPELRKKQSESHKGQIPWIKGKHHSEKNKMKMSETRKRLYSEGKIIHAMKGKHHSEETKKKISESHKGQVAWNKGKSPSEETKKKISESTRKSMSNLELRRRMSESDKRTWNKLEYRKLARERRAKQIFPLKDSKPEIKIQNFLKQLGITFLKHKHIQEIEHGYQCDIFIPSMNLIIEVDGDYWHGNQNLARFKDLNEHQKNRKLLDNLRTKELIEKGYKVLRFWESDIKKMNLEDFMKRIK